MRDLVRRAHQLRRDFPILQRLHPSGQPLIYLDNAATAQKPQKVLHTLQYFLTTVNANIHRGVHWLSQEATRLYEEARVSVAEFLGADSEKEIVFVKGATEGINLVAQGLRRVYFQPGDEILLTVAEHHANIVPWQLVAEELPLVLRPVPLTATGGLDVTTFLGHFSERTRFVAVTAMSNVLGTEMPVAALVQAARQRGVPILIDACQAVVHQPVNVRAWGADFVVFSGH
ncbi:MAG: aminotransferase class V-fold PLP-dependent enzyme, partial [Bacteroidia bacterium]|nr:aminotransferase class V-fold PLP-dependent enzyme [Bacteroidia bacterium]